jgi:hypothetical protein
LKRSFYLFILNKVSERLFYFLRDKVSPIKYLEERPKGEIWFHKRNSEGRISIEVEIKRIPSESCIYIDNESGLFNIIGEDYKVNIYEQLSDVEPFRRRFRHDISFLINHLNGTDQVDYYFSKVDELKTELRNYKLKNILN